jgi:hypothetical protein
MATKRARVSPPSVENILHFARIIMNDDPFKEVAPKEEDKRFRALFGCPPNVCIVVWYKLLRSDLIPEQGTMVHLLWTLMYCKTYPKWSTMKMLSGGADPKTLRHWIGLFRESIGLLEYPIVSVESK